jgi:flavorubredoxin
MKKALVAYDSLYGNTERIAKALAQGLESEGVDVSVAKVGMVDFDELAKVDLLCVGAPIHAWNASKPVKDFLERLKTEKGSALHGKKGFSFDTKVKSRLAGSAADKIEGKLKEIGLTIIRKSESAVVNGREGPLEESAEKTFRLIGVDLAKKL